MATHSSVPAWELPWSEEPGGLQAVESQRAGHDWVTEHTLFLQRTSAEKSPLWHSEETPENSKGQGSLACCSPWGRRLTSNYPTITVEGLNKYYYVNACHYCHSQSNPWPWL